MVWLRTRSKKGLFCCSRAVTISNCCCGEAAARSTPNRFGSKVRLLQAIAIGWLVAAIRAHELAIDVGEHAGLRSAGKIVGGDDLVADSGKRRCFTLAQERVLSMLAGRECGARQSACGYEFAPVEHGTCGFHPYIKRQLRA